MALDIGYVSAVAAGALSFLSPCVLPLVPPYLCYMAGVSVDDFRGQAGAAAKTGARGALMAASIAFVLGFSTVFIALGAAGASADAVLAGARSSRSVACVASPVAASSSRRSANQGASRRCQRRIDAYPSWGAGGVALTPAM